MNSNYFYQAWEGEKMLEKIKRTVYKVAIYIRQSKESKDKGYHDSQSITNQKAKLKEYVDKLVWE